MENLEEVLQALDEFQKMRPTEIPRELEDYLCWVAKTGDPVYQWSLIKTLFREKLTRVMTDFYESCPTLELAPCPNVEHFNYDTMKTSLLERLESFANAPFTVQRICELLTAPRKEYNRVDKFMRAIEKNILVVSTREPGPIARRSENGDGMVNGSVEEEASVTQPPQDVEMEYWEKDCASTVTISVHTVENETPMLHTVIPTTAVVKNVFGTEDVHGKLTASTPAGKPHNTPPIPFIPNPNEYAGVSSVSSQTETQEANMSENVQNNISTTVTPEGPGIVSDVSEAIINEDTSSQPGLDLENEDSDNTESTKKLQTTFQAKDFTTGDDKSSKFYQEDAKPSEKISADEAPTIPEETLITTEKLNEPIVNSSSKSETAIENSEAASPIVESLLQVPETDLEHREKLDAISDGTQSIAETSDVQKTEQHLTDDTSANASLLENGETKLSTLDQDTKQAIALDETSDSTLDVSEFKSKSTTVDPVDESKITAEDDFAKEPKVSIEDSVEKQTLTITETIENENESENKILNSEPVPIIEEPKDSEPVHEKISDSLSAIDVTDEVSNTNTSTREESQKLTTCENTDGTQLEESNSNAIKENEPIITEADECKPGKDQMELMEVDEDEALSMFQQDEPMDQETVELSKS